MLRFTLAVPLSFLALLAVVPSASAGTPFTNLGPGGNLYVASRFEQFLSVNHTHGQANGLICDAPQADRHRIILTGFGPFDGLSENVSGRVLEDLAGFSRPYPDVDAFGQTQFVLMHDKSYQICMLEVSTAWDLSAAILIHEIENFAPELVLMTGVGSAKLIFETGNSNRAVFSGGYDIYGRPAPGNMPIEHYVLPPTDPAVPFISHLTWDTDKIKHATDADVKSLGFESVILEPGYASNDYICNNLAFTVTHAVQNLRTELAGGLVVFNPQLAHIPIVGFMHYPANASMKPASLKSWASILKKIIATQN